MAKLNPALMKRPPPIVETRTFANPQDPENPFVLTLRALHEAPFRLDMEVKIAEYVQDYVTGAKDGDGRQKPPKPIYTVDNETAERRGITLTPMVCRYAAYLEGMQVPEDGDSLYTFEELVKLSVMIGESFLEAGSWASTLLDPAPQPNPSPANTAQSSVSEPVSDDSTPT